MGFFNLIYLRKLFIIFLFLSFYSSFVHSQMQATITTTANTLCDGQGCNWNGPSILINEMMMSPTTSDGSLWEPNCNANDRCGEWIELYNPNICQPVDVSCYHLGNNTYDVSGDYPGGYTIPQGTIVPPAGFLVIRGERAMPVPLNKLVQNGGKTIELVTNSANVCIGGGSRLWFPNAGSWFAFYDANGVPQDAVSWGSSSSLNGHPCVPNVPGCSVSGQLASYNQIPANRKTVVYGTFPNSWGLSVRRMPDGGNWITGQGATPTIGGCNAVCATPGTSNCNGTATISVTGGTPPYTYYWGDSQSQHTATATGLCAGTYPVYVSDAANHHQTFMVTISDFQPTVNFTVQSPVCNEGQTVPFTNIQPIAGTNQTGVFSGTAVSGNQFNVAQSGEGTFPITYTFTDEHGCTNSIAKDIIVLPNPNPVISGLNPDYCISDGVIPFQVSPSGGTLSGNGVVNGTFDVAAAGVGTHTIHYEVTTADGCFGETDVQVQVHALPQVSAGEDQTVCIHQSATFQPSGATSYSWDNGLGNSSSPTVTPATTTTYTVVGTDNHGCKNTDQVTIYVLDAPNVQTNVDQDICVGDSVQLTVTGAVNYTWSQGLGSGASHTVSPQSTTIYTVTGSASNGCVGKDSVKVTVHSLPDVSAGADFYYCVNATGQVHATGASTYVWNHGLGSGATHDIMPQQTTTYTVIGTDQWGCVNTDSVVVKVIHTLPTADFSIIDTAGCSPLSTAFSSVTSSNVVSCHWSLSTGQALDGCGTVGIMVADTGCHDVTLSVISDSGCVVSKTYFDAICVFPNPIAEFNMDPSSIYLPFNEDTVVISNHSTGAVQYSWSLPHGETSDLETPFVDFSHDSTSATYVIYLTAISDHGCVDTTFRVFRVFEDLIYYIPNTFTPDGDRFNNVFKPIFSYGFDTDDYELLIYDRWGEIIFETHDVNYGWDGTYQGKKCPDGTYVWSIHIRKRQSTDFLDIKGHITILR